MFAAFVSFSPQAQKEIIRNEMKKKCLGWINLLVGSRVKCNNGIKRENSA